MATKFKNGITSEASISLPYRLVTGPTTLTATDYTVGCNSLYTITALTTTNTQWTYTAAGHGMAAGTVVNVTNLNPSSQVLYNGAFVITSADANTFTVDAVFAYGNNTYTGLSGRAYGSFTVTLPSAVGIQGRIYNIKNLADGIISVGTTSSQTIDGAGSYALENSYHGITVQSTGSNWIVI